MELNQDFSMDANNNFEIRFDPVINLKDGSIIQVGDILDVTWGFAPYQEETTPIAEKSLGSGITVPENGVVLVTLLPSDTADLCGEFSHELRLFGDKGVISGARGRMTIRYQIPTNPS